MKFKETWTSFKERFIEDLKFIILAIVFFMGAWTICAVAWFASGLPQDTWAMYLLFGVALICEWLYFKWLSN